MYKVYRIEFLYNTSKFKVSLSLGQWFPTGEVTRNLDSTTGEYNENLVVEIITPFYNGRNWEQ